MVTNLDKKAQKAELEYLVLRFKELGVYSAMSDFEKNSFFSLTHEEEQEPLENRYGSSITFTLDKDFVYKFSLNVFYVVFSDFDLTPHYKYFQSLMRSVGVVPQTKEFELKYDKHGFHVAEMKVNGDYSTSPLIADIGSYENNLKVLGDGMVEFVKEIQNGYDDALSTFNQIVIKGLA